VPWREVAGGCRSAPAFQGESAAETLTVRKAPGRTVEGKVRFGRACIHPDIEQTDSKSLRLVYKNARAQGAPSTGWDFNEESMCDSKK